MADITLTEKERLIQQEFNYSDEMCRKITEIMENRGPSMEEEMRKLFKTQPHFRKITDFL